MTGEIKSLQQIQKRGATNKQLLSQFPGAKPRTQEAQIAAAQEELRELDVKSNDYAKSLAELTKRQEKYNAELREQALISKNLFQMDQSRPLETTRYELPDPKQGSEGIKTLSKKPIWERFAHWLFESPDWKKANRMPDPGEVSQYGGYKARRIQEQNKFAYGIPGIGLELPKTTNALQFGLAKVQDKLGDLTVGSTQYKTVLGEVAKAQHSYNRALSQTTKDLRNAVNMLPTSRGVLNARRNLSGSRRLQGRAGSGFSNLSADAGFGSRDLYGSAYDRNPIRSRSFDDQFAFGNDGRAIQKALARRQRDQAKRQGFTKSSNTPFEVSGLYNQISSIGMSDIGANIDRMGKSWRTVRKDILAATKASNGSISSLQSQRSAFEQLRLGLDPTSKAFRRLTKDISQVDKQLNKLNTNKFSGKNLARTGQSILGASFFGGPAGFLGSSLGAGFEALRPGGDMAQGAIAGGLVGSQVLQPIAAFGSESATYTAMIEKSKIALEAATKIEGDAIASKEAYAIALRTAAGVTERFNVPQELAARGMTRLSAAVIGAGGNIHNAGIAFENISAAIKATGGSTEDTKAAVTAMVQIFSKGRVSAEELSGQLGERFPAAVTLFAEANNMTTQELQKGLKDGAIGLDKLWKFVLKLGDKYKGVAEAIGDASVEAGVRSQIAWNEVKLAVGTALQPIGADLQVIGAEILTSLVPALTKLAEVTGAVLQVFSGALVGIVENLDKAIASIGAFIAATTILHGQALAALTKALIFVPLQSFISSLGLAAIGQKAFASATGMATAQVRIFNIAMNKNLIILGATALVAAGSAVWHFGRQWQRTVDEIEKGKMPLNDARIKVAELEKALKGESNEKLRLRLQTQIDMYKEAIQTRMELVKAAELAEAESFKNASAKPDEGKWATLQEYVDELGEGGKHLQDTFINAFKGMEDAMVNFVMTGKLNFKEFARSVIADIARMIAKQMLFNMLSGFVSSLGGGGLGMTQGKNMPSNPSFVGVGANQNFGKTIGVPKGLENLQLNALGNAYGKNGIVPFYKGGIVNRPTLFPFADGTGLMGEAGPEAIVPLKRGRDGKLGVAGGGGTTTVNVSVDAKGTKVEGDGKQMAQLGRMLGSAIEMELAKQKRPGGLLA